MKVGIDIIKVKRFLKIKHLDSFFKKNYSEYEIDYIQSKKNQAQTMAGIFAAKESFLKALQVGIAGFSYLKEVEVRHTPLGAPYIKVSKKISKDLDLKQDFTCTLSISHTKDIASAICIIN